MADLTEAKLQKMLCDGHFRKLTAEEASREPDNTWYLPLMAVRSQNKPKKCVWYWTPQQKATE